MHPKYYISKYVVYTDMNRLQNLGVSKETFSLTLGGRLTIPLAISKNTPVQSKGSLIYDPLLASLFYSDSTNWIKITDSTTHTQCIVNEAGDTSVCTDTEPPTDSKVIYFTTDAVLRAIFNSDGVLVATAGSVDPTTVAPGAGECANFQGDVSVTGNVFLSIPLSEVYGGTGQNSYATGDTIYASGVDMLSKLPIGSADQVYTVSGGVPSWQDPQIVQTGPEVPNTQANGDDYDFLPVEIDGNARYIPLTSTPALNGQNDNLQLICMGADVCGGVSGVARTILQNPPIGGNSIAIGRDVCENWNAAVNTSSYSNVLIGSSSIQNLGAGQRQAQDVCIGTGTMTGSIATQSGQGNTVIGYNSCRDYQPANQIVCIGNGACTTKPTNNLDDSFVKIGATIQTTTTQTGGRFQVLVGTSIMQTATCTFVDSNRAVMVGYNILRIAGGQLGPDNLFLGGAILNSATLGAANVRGNTILGGNTLSAAAVTLSSRDAICIGGESLTSAGAGIGTDSIIIGGRTFVANVAPLNINVIAIGAAQTGVPNASEVMIGKSCAAAGVTGRLSFGSAMEAISATATAGAAVLPVAPSGFLVISHNGTIRKIPVYAN
jgi:hypothetical protein